MWLLNFFPSLLIHLILATGIIVFLVATFFTAIPFIGKHSTAAQVVGACILGIGLYLEGGLSYKEKVEKDVLELQVKFNKAEAESERLNGELQSKLNSGTTIIKERGQTIIKYLESDAGRQYDSKCVIPDDIIDAHNQAATLESTRSSEPRLPARQTP